MTTIRVNRKAAERARSGHPWMFSSDVVDRGQALAGDVVRVVDPRGELVGSAHYSATSQITLRLLSSGHEEGGRAFFLRRLLAAKRHRDRVVEASTACRVVSSEGDLLPGLIVDKYGPYLAVQLLTQGMDRARDVIVDCLQEIFQPVGILARNDASVRRLENLPQEISVLAGEVPERVSIEMNGLKLQADLRKGQKTGIYLDQRENYVATARWARGRMLDCFTSTGGFALHAARNVEGVEAVDSSAGAIETAEANARSNGIGNVQFRQADVFEYLTGRGQKFSTIVLDPPSFAKSRKAIDDAARGYKEINLRALKLLEPRGILVTCSCSHHMSEALLFETVAQAALDAGRTLRVIERRTQAADHPILLTVPETLYLKCLILEVLEG